MMRTLLKLKLIALDTHDGDLWYELAKEVDLPFAPYDGLRLMLSPIMDNHPDAKKFDGILQRSSEVETGIFTVDRVLYQVDEQRFDVRQDRGYPDVPTLRQTVEQLIVGYGFMQKWPIADERVD